MFSSRSGTIGLQARQFSPSPIGAQALDTHGSYAIYRSPRPITSTTDAVRIAVVSGSESSFVDYNPLPGRSYYMIVPIATDGVAGPPSNDTPVDVVTADRRRAVRH